MPDDTVRPATPADHPLFAQFFRELGVPEAPPDAERWASAHMATSFFLERDGEPVGYARYDTVGVEGYIRHVVTHPAHRGLGVGRGLMEALGERFRAAGCVRQRLNVKTDNTAARALYAAFGMSVEHPTTVLAMPPALARAPRVATVAAEAPPEADAALEARFGLIPGRLGLARRTAGATVIVAQQGEAGEPVGVAAYDRHLPGCFPFRVHDEDAADALMAGVAALERGCAAREAPLTPSGAGPPRAWQLALENHPAVAARLLERGAALVFELVHLCGPLR